MITESGFYIYTRKYGFYNRDKLNDTGKEIYDLLIKMQSSIDSEYTIAVEYIKVTSQDRPDDEKTTPHYNGKAIDLVIYPVEYMPYFFGLIHLSYPYNMYLGTYIEYQGIKKNNGHIHIDNYYHRPSGIVQNRKAWESKTGSIHLFLESNVEHVMSFYNFGLKYSLTGFKKTVRDLLLTSVSTSSKIPMNTHKNKFSFISVLPYIIIFVSAAYVYKTFKGENNHGA